MEHLVVNVEEQIAKRFYDRGFNAKAVQAIARSETLRDDTPLDDLVMSRLVPLTDEEKAEREKSAKAAALQNLRDDRDALLVASDWTQLPDVPSAKQKAWAAYRKKLRDLPKTTKDPAEVEWPDPPK